MWALDLFITLALVFGLFMYHPVCPMLSNLSDHSFLSFGPLLRPFPDGNRVFGQPVDTDSVICKGVVMEHEETEP